MVSTIRLAAFAGIFCIMALWEWISPRRSLTQKKSLRWFINLSLTAVDVILVQLLLGAIAFATALIAQQKGWGLMNYFSLSTPVAIPLSIVALDFAIYVQHVLFHSLPILWRLHRVHHTDLDFDVTTGIRFHPLEIILSLFYKIAVIAAIGAPPLAVLIFEIILNATSQFNHGNVRIPETIDKWLRWVLVTPDVHRVHHSTLPTETNSNFGFSVTWWDRLCGTFRNQPRLTHQGMEIGLRQYRDQRNLGLVSLLILPFFGKTGPYSIDRSE